MNGFNGMNWGMGFGWIFGIVILAPLVWTIMRFASAYTPLSAKKHCDALEVLKNRYAAGEIDKEEYEEKKRNLSK